MRHLTLKPSPFDLYLHAWNKVVTLGNRTQDPTGMGGPGPVGYLDGANISLGEHVDVILHWIVILLLNVLNDSNPLC